MPENESIPAALIVEALKEAFRSQRTAPPKAGEPLGWILSVPDTHQRSVIAELEGDSDLRLLTCSTEDEANAIAAGLYVGGAEVALMIQHAGLYASVNTLRGVGLDGGVPLFALVGLLSREPELEPRESPRSMVRFAGPLMDTFGVPHALLETRDDLGRIPEYYGAQPGAIGAGDRVRRQGDGLMRPEDVLRAINEARGEALVVPTMTAVPEWRTIAPDAPSVACVGFMGGASSLGLGLALAQPERRVIVLDGDGSLLMQLGSLATVAGAAPANYTHVLFANGVYQTSGSQAIPGAGAVDFAGMAEAAGYAFTTRIDTLEELRIRLPELLSTKGPVLVELAVEEAERTPMTAPGGDPLRVQVERLRERLAGEG